MENVKEKEIKIENKNSEIFARKEGDEDLMYGIWYNGNKYCLSRERKNITSGRGSGGGDFAFGPK
jgi:hypothetical protein